MGLDMYLYRAKMHGYSAEEVAAAENYLDWQEHLKEDCEKHYSCEEWSGTKEEDVNLDAVAALTPEYTMGYPSWDTEHRYGRLRIFQMVGYWRKANHIHNWFVENVQNGKDDCGTYIVTRDQLQTLLDTCKHVLSVAKTEDGKVHVGTTYKPNGAVEQNYEDGRIVTNADACASILPTTPGFFFGNTDYDEYYIRDVQETIKILETVFATTDFETETICYGASW